jgi:hypothetical protein
MSLVRNTERGTTMDLFTCGICGRDDDTQYEEDEYGIVRCANCMRNAPAALIGTCDDCGAEGVAIWLTEYNWQCARCIAENTEA